MEGIVDIHCHILPAVDDGADSIDTALEMLEEEWRQGVRKVLLTPHYRQGYFETERREVRERFRELSKLCAGKLPELRLYLGCEFHRQADMARMLREEPAYRIADTGYVLTEFSAGDRISEIRGCITDLLIHGYRPVIAHAERYPALHDRKQVRFLIESGAYIQVNAGSILGREGFRSRQFVWHLLKEHCVHLIGSDAHDLHRRSPCLGECAAYLGRKLGSTETERILVRNPEKLLMNEYL